MSKRTDPWFKFYPSDWRGESSLRAVSMAARGLWIEMLCLMHESEPRGHLLLNGRPVTDAQLASLAGVPVDIAQALLGELETAGTFSRTRAGVIYSRRMRKDTSVSAKQRANVEKRWSKQSEKTTAQDVDISNENDHRITKQHTTELPKKLEARVQKEPYPEIGKIIDLPVNGVAVPGKGRRLWPDWEPSPTDTAYAISKGLSGAALDGEIENFRDWWISKSGKDALKTDWPATWRRWVRTAVERKPQGGPRKQVDWC